MTIHPTTAKTEPCPPVARRLRALFWAGAVLTAVATVLIAFDWERSGGPAFVVTLLLFSVVIVVAPWTHGIRPRYLAALPSLSGTAFLVSGALYVFPTPAKVGPFTAAEATVIPGYLFVGLWLILLSRRAAGNRFWGTILDTGAAVVGGSLAMWTLMGSAAADESLNQRAIVIAAYPTIDIVLVALAVHLALQMGAFSRAATWCLASLLILWSADMASAVYVLSTSSDPPTITFGAQLCGFLGLAAGTAHPSFRMLTTPAEADERRPGRERVTIVMLTLVPTILAAALPTRDDVDGIVRGLLVTALLSIVTVRVWHTLSDLSAAESESYFRATHDHLTNLLNRSAMLDELQSRLRRDARAGRSTMVMFLDIDKFKEINDTLGHDAGDAILHHVARGLPPQLRADDVVARHGGDEFVIVASVERPDDVVVLADRVMRFFDGPVRLTAGVDRVVTPSVGVAVAAPGEEVRPEDLITRADLAMYRAKRSGRGRWMQEEAG